MKRIFRKIVTVAAMLILLLPVFLFAACSVEPRSEDDVIPKALGEAEGLWLYCGNMRSRTDGTKEETLLKSVTVEDVEYGEGDFTIIAQQYVRATHEIFYVISVGKQYRAYHYNYLTKQSSDLCALSPAEKPYDYQITVSSSLVYIYNTRTKYGVILSTAAQLLYENFYDGTLDGEVVYRISSFDITYFKEGAYHEIPLSTSYHSSAYHRYGNYAYLFGSAACVVDLETEEVFPLPAINAVGNVYFSDVYCADGVFYALIVNYVTRGDETDHMTRLFQVSGKTAQLLYDFGSAAYGMRMGINGNEIHFTQYGPRDRQTKYFVYNVTTGAMKKVTAKQGGKGKTPDELKKEAEAQQRQEKLSADITVGEYKFYVTSIDYDDQPGMFGTHYTKTCYYLMRDYNGKSEVMQYSLNQNGGHFYDDILEF